MVSLTHNYCSSWIERENIPRFLKAIYLTRGLLFTDDQFISVMHYYQLFLLVILAELTTAAVDVVEPEIQKLHF